jgi:DNA-binding transcriptional LysR family regulator
MVRISRVRITASRGLQIGYAPFRNGHAMSKRRDNKAERDSGNDELLLFLRIASMIDEGESLTGVAKRLDMSPSTISLLLNRIADAFPKTPLVTRKAGASGGTELTDTGTKLLTTVLDAFQKLRGHRSRLMVVSSQSLVTNQIISPVIADFLSGPDRENVNFRLRLETNLKYHQLLRMVLDREVDLGVVWGSAQRIKHVPGVEITPLSEHPFDLVFVSHDKSVVQRINEILDRISENDHSKRMSQLSAFVRRLSIATLDVDSQPLSEILPTPDSFDGRNSILVDTFDAAIAIVRSKVADLALIPGMYASLLRLRELGQIYFSKPVDRIPVVILSPHSVGISEPAKNLVSRLKRRLSELFRRRADLVEVSTILPELNDCKRLRFGYFIDANPDHEVDSSRVPDFAWVWEEIQWPESDASDRDVIRGASTNANRYTYRLTARKTTAGIVVEASKIDDERSTGGSEIPSWVSTFRLAARSPLRLLGTWTSLETEFPNVYAGVLSEVPLDLHDLVFLQEAVEYRSVLSADTGIRFDEQPGCT